MGSHRSFLVETPVTNYIYYELYTVLRCTMYVHQKPLFPRYVLRVSVLFALAAFLQEFKGSKRLCLFFLFSPSSAARTTQSDHHWHASSRVQRTSRSGKATARLRNICPPPSEVPKGGRSRLLLSFFLACLVSTLLRSSRISLTGIKVAFWARATSSTAALSDEKVAWKRD